MPFKFTTLKLAAAALTMATALPALAAGTTVKTAVQGYRFELAGPAHPAATGKHAVSVRLVGVTDGKPVSGAIVMQTRLDMSPENMATMTAPVREMTDSAPGVYSFSFDDRAVWKWKGDWALTVTAKVPGSPQTVTGRVVFHAGT